MELDDLIAALSDPAAYGKPPGTRVEVVQTHISAVFLVEDEVFKLKKPVALGFVDYSTPALRKRYCELEVSLNRRLAPEVYLGVLPVTREGGRVRVGAEGEVLDHVVHMRRLPDAAQLGERVARGEVGGALLAELGARIAGFHREGRRGPEVSAWARFDAFARNARENFTHIAAAAEIPASLRDLVARLTDEALETAREPIERRAERNVARDTHGDLRLDHIYFFPEEPPPRDLVIVDCIEFAERFRCSDPVSDLAFLVMDLRRVGRDDLASALTRGYFEAIEGGDALGDEGEAREEAREGRALLPLFVAYRAAVRAKVDALRSLAPEIPSPARAEAHVGALRHLMLALTALRSAPERPCLLLVAGLPGTGKSTLARALAEEGFSWIRSDVVRKELAGLAPTESATAAPGEGVYTPEWTARTYAECLARARARLLAGERVVVDANFRAEAQRAPFLTLAAELGVPLRIMLCEADEGVVRDRLAAREGDASDADFAVYLRAREEWEPLGPELSPACDRIDTGGSPSEAKERALTALRGAGLA